MMTMWGEPWPEPNCSRDVEAFSEQVWDDMYWSEMNSWPPRIRDDSFAHEVLHFVSERIEAEKLKPWGWKGRRVLLNVASEFMDGIACWHPCLYCGHGFQPRVDERLIDTFLEYWCEWTQLWKLFRCADCGGVAYERREPGHPDAPWEELDGNFPHEKWVQLIREKRIVL